MQQKVHATSTFSGNEWEASFGDVPRWSRWTEHWTITKFLEKHLHSDSYPYQHNITYITNKTSLKAPGFFFFYLLFFFGCCHPEVEWFFQKSISKYRGKRFYLNSHAFNDYRNTGCTRSQQKSLLSDCLLAWPQCAPGASHTKCCSMSLFAWRRRRHCVSVSLYGFSSRGVALRVLWGAFISGWRNVASLADCHKSLRYLVFLRCGPDECDWQGCADWLKRQRALLWERALRQNRSVIRCSQWMRGPMERAEESWLTKESADSRRLAAKWKGTCRSTRWEVGNLLLSFSNITAAAFSLHAVFSSYSNWPLPAESRAAAVGPAL